MLKEEFKGGKQEWDLVGLARVLLGIDKNEAVEEHRRNGGEVSDLFRSDYHPLDERGDDADGR